MKKRQTGFTLIELVIVISIIAALTAVALPKYVAVQKDARVAKMQAIYGSVRTAAALAKARCELDLAAVVAGGLCTATAGSVNMDGTTVTMVNRYPAAGSIAVAAGVDSVNDGMTVVVGASTTFTAAGASTPASCLITYNEAAANAAPVITLDTTGC